MVGHYVQHFPTVEINNSFYRQPKAGAWQLWQRSAPDGFRFAVKANRYLTHVKRLGWRNRWGASRGFRCWRTVGAGAVPFRPLPSHAGQRATARRLPELLPKDAARSSPSHIRSVTIA
jgi:uncharacterized protein YecE (DUF72 family)